MKHKLPERRRFVRIEVPLRLLVRVNGKDVEAVTRDISPVGLRFCIEKELDLSKGLSMKLFIPLLEDSIDVSARIVWQKKISLEDAAPFDVGVEITHIQEIYKNVFLEYLCGLLYDSKYKFRS